MSNVPDIIAKKTMGSNRSGRFPCAFDRFSLPPELRWLAGLLWQWRAEKSLHYPRLVLRADLHA